MRPRRDSSRIYKLCSLLLEYPDDELLAARRELEAAAGEHPALRRFCRWWADVDPLELQQQYVETFDLGKRCGLYLSYYGEGDRRQRGMALLRLKRLYEAAGLPLAGSELPDFLPVMLEFAGAAPKSYGQTVLSEHRAALELLRASLRERGSPYADVLGAICDAVGEATSDDRARAARIAAQGPPQELVGLETLR